MKVGGHEKSTAQGEISRFPDFSFSGTDESVWIRPFSQTHDNMLTGWQRTHPAFLLAGGCTPRRPLCPFLASPQPAFAAIWWACCHLEIFLVVIVPLVE